MKADAVVAILVAASVALAALGAYEYSQSSYEAGLASGLSTQVSWLSGASSTLQAQLSQAQSSVTSLTTARDSLQAQLAEANANLTSLQNQVKNLDGEISQLASQIDQYKSLLSLSVTNTLVSSQEFNLPPNGQASFTDFPFTSQTTPRSWGDVGIVVRGDSSTPARVSQTGYEDCVFVANCTVSMGMVAPGDVLLVFVAGYSPNAGWHAESVNDTLGSTFTQYGVVDWNASTNAYTDSVFYAPLPAGAPSDSVTVTYNSFAQHSDPIVMDVTGSGLSIYSGASADCTHSCTTSLSTSPAPLPGDYVAAATAYPDLGVAATAGSGWTQVSSGAVLQGGTSSFITGEYATALGGGDCSLLPILPSNYVAKYPGYLSVNGTTSSASAAAVVSYPGTTQTTATYPLGTSVSVTIPILPGAVNVQLEDCGPTPLVATLTITEVT